MKHVITSKEKDFTVVYEYIDGVFTKVQVEGVVNNLINVTLFPTEVELIQWAKPLFKERYEMLPDVAPLFEDFWATYTPIAKASYGDNPDKKRAEDKWKLLTDVDKIKAVAFLKKYALQVKPHTFKCACEAKTYLHNRLWKQ